MVRRALLLLVAIIGGALLGGCDTEPPNGFFDGAPRMPELEGFWFGSWSGSGQGNGFYMDLQQTGDGKVEDITGIVFSSVRGFGTIVGTARVGRFVMVARYPDDFSEEFHGSSYPQAGEYLGEVEGDFQLVPSVLAFQGSTLSSGTVTGTVRNGGIGIADATVSIGVREERLEAVTNSAGNFTIPNVPGGSRVVSATKNGYTAALKGVVVDGNVGTGYIYLALSGGSTPPVVTTTAPADGSRLSVDIQNETASLVGVEGAQAVVSVNGAESVVPVNGGGSLDYVLILFRGVNVITTQVKNAAGISEKTLVVNCEVAATRLRVTLIWNTGTTLDGSTSNRNDQDLHVWYYPPVGPTQHAFYGNKTAITGGRIDVDNVWGFGPENFTMATAGDGNYRVAVNYYSGGDPTALIVRVAMNGGSADDHAYVFGPTTVASSNGNNGYPVTGSTSSWFRVVDMTVTNGVVSLSGGANPDVGFPLED